MCVLFSSEYCGVCVRVSLIRQLAAVLCSTGYNREPRVNATPPHSTEQSLLLLLLLHSSRTVHFIIPFIRSFHNASRE